jgi:hypothetical protein
MEIHFGDVILFHGCNVRCFDLLWNHHAVSLAENKSWYVMCLCLFLLEPLTTSRHFQVHGLSGKDNFRSNHVKLLFVGQQSLNSDNFIHIIITREGGIFPFCSFSLPFKAE